MNRAQTNQELLDRYVHSVQMLLPPGKADDIAAEIRSNLQSLAEDQARELGRELNLEELSAIVKRHGHPMVVASRYRDQPGRGLISPELFPFYWFTLRAIFALWVTIRVIVAVFALQGTASAGSILLRLGRDVLLAGFFIAAGVTLLFAAWEYLEFKFRYSEKWKPESLPPVHAPRIKQPRPVVTVMYGVVSLIFWAMPLFLPALWWVWGGRGVFSPSAALYAMRLPLWLLALFGISQSWLSYTLRYIQVAAVCAHRRERRGIGAGALPAARGRFTGSGSELGSRSAKVIGNSESGASGDIDAGLYFLRPAVCV
jgi:hypothetical protein